MIKQKLIRVFAATAVIGFASIALNANAAQPTPAATANAVILTPLSIVEDAQMDFGSVAPDAAGGNVVLTTAGTIPAPPANFVLSGVPAAGAFTVTGETGLSYAISFPGAPFTLNQIAPAGADTMSIDTFTTSIVATVATPRVLPAATDSFTVGATLTVGANQTPATYQGNYVIQVDYQ